MNDNKKEKGDFARIELASTGIGIFPIRENERSVALPLSYKPPKTRLILLYKIYCYLASHLLGLLCVFVSLVINYSFFIMMNT